MARRVKDSLPSGPGLLPPERLRWTCDPAQFPFRTTREAEGTPISIIGQPRAMEALRLGLSLASDGYNIFVAGEVGTGRSTTVRKVLEELERGKQAPDDLAYVHNFRDPDQPRLLSFPAGRGTAFRKAMDDMLQGLLKSVPELFDSEPYRRRRNATVEAAQERQKARLKEFERKVQEEGFTLAQVQVGPLVRPVLMPVVAGNPVDMDQLESVVEEGKFQRREFDRLKAKQTKLMTALEGLTKEFRQLERELRGALLKLDQDVARPVVEEAVTEIADAFPGDRIAAYLLEVTEDILANLDRFRDGQEPAASDAEAGKSKPAIPERMLPYAVNVVVDHTGAKGRPILWETNPSYRNLFGSIERVREASGEWATDHTRIKAGSLPRANGGFLVLDAMDVLVETGVWPALKRTLRNRVLEIQSFDPWSLLASVSLKPEPIPMKVKVILIGTRHIYRLLHALDEDFKKIFKIKAEFALETDRSPDEMANYAAFVRKKCQDEGLPPFNREAVAGVVEQGVRLAGRSGKLTTRFNEVADLIREAGWWARQDGVDVVEVTHVDRALEHQVHRVDLVQVVLRERFADGSVLLDITGERVGQVNGLVVLDVGDHVFGLPSKITAVAAMGRAGIVNVEREAELSGAIHTKGVLILSAFLRERFAQDKPLTLSASLTFEQNYAEVDGDSASSAELYALLSSLSGVPIRQGIAVTGSVNQKGEIQPIGGVNEKIEGYFDVCRAVGLTGEQGVMIPAQNEPNLMLRKDLVEAVREGRFHVWSVRTLEEGIEILTGRPAGARGSGGAWEEGSVFALADARLRELAEGVRDFGPADR
jgi:lon-related putative ATP-dependent protease